MRCSPRTRHCEPRSSGYARAMRPGRASAANEEGDPRTGARTVRSRRSRRARAQSHRAIR
jgi:hypothetical protein